MPPVDWPLVRDIGLDLLRGLVTGAVLQARNSCPACNCSPSINLPSHFVAPTCEVCETSVGVRLTLTISFSLFLVGLVCGYLLARRGSSRTAAPPRRGGVWLDQLEDDGGSAGSGGGVSRRRRAPGGP